MTTKLSLYSLTGRIVVQALYEVLLIYSCVVCACYSPGNTCTLYPATISGNYFNEMNASYKDGYLAFTDNIQCSCWQTWKPFRHLGTRYPIGIENSSKILKVSPEVSSRVLFLCKFLTFWTCLDRFLISIGLVRTFLDLFWTFLDNMITLHSNPIQDFFEFQNILTAADSVGQTS